MARMILLVSVLYTTVLWREHAFNKKGLSTGSCMYIQ